MHRLCRSGAGRDKLCFTQIPPIQFAIGRINCHTRIMMQKVAVTLEKRTVGDLDRWVREGKYPNRSRALQAAVNLLADRERRTRLARELSKLDRQEERQMAEE